MNKLFIAALLVLPLSLAACDSSMPAPPARVVEQAAAQEQQSKFNQSSPIPVLPMSQERENLIKRAKRINVQNMTGCVNLLDHGILVASFVVNGKVSSLNSYLLSGEQIVSDPHTSLDGRQSLVVEQPDIDGAYGQNANGIFFFTADTDAYVEWNQGYIYTDQCLVTTSSPLLVQKVE
jgi:hypothetical protein